MRIELRVLLAACIAAFGPGALGAEGRIEVPMRDPWVPPSLAKEARVTPGSIGAALQQEVEQKLRARFEEAAGPSGTLSREGARAAGLGHVARNFDAIDRRGAGAVTFDDYKRFLKEQGAALQ